MLLMHSDDQCDYQICDYQVSHFIFSCLFIHVECKNKNAVGWAKCNANHIKPMLHDIWGILQAESITISTAKLPTICIVPQWVSYVVLRHPWHLNITSFTFLYNPLGKPKDTLYLLKCFVSTACRQQVYPLERYG